MSTPDLGSSVHVSVVEPADLVAVVVLLEEEAIAPSSLIACLLTVLKGSLVVIRGTVAWVSIADTIVAVVSEGDLAVSWSIMHPVDVSVADEAVLNYDIGICSGEEEEGKTGSIHHLISLIRLLFNLLYFSELGLIFILKF